MPYMIGCDIGTTNVKAVAFASVSGDILASHSIGYEMFHPQPDWSEQDADEIFDATCQSLAAVHASCKANGTLLGVSFSAAMHGLMALDENGKKLTNLIIWADNRASEIAAALKKSKVGKRIYKHNGTPIHAMTPLCKLLWIKKHEPSLFKAASKFCGIKEYVIYRFTGKFLVDYSIASATGLFDIRELKWDENTLKRIGVKAGKMPEAVSPYQVERLPESNPAGLPAHTPLIMGASDGCLANLGSGAVKAGTMAVTVGTSGAARICADKAYSDPMMQTFCYILDEKTYIVGGPTNNGAVILEWMMKTFFDGEDYDTVLKLASGVAPGADGLAFYPYLLGERAPLWSSEVRGAFLGMDIAHTRAHVAKAVMEGVLMNIYVIGEVLLKMQKTAVIYANGGFAKSPYWVQMLADIFGKKVVLNETVETGASGAVMMGLKALGVYEDYSQMEAFTLVGREFEPDLAIHLKYKALREKFEKGSKLVLDYAV